ncbi:MAG: acetate--CoA ligase family protein [Actinobacteria bacterium]|nr:acetate--CoA ligase family protein [Actinomycetota bacterium]
MRGFFEPETVAVVGVSNEPDNLGRTISMNLLAFDFRGIVYEVGPKGGSLYGRRIYRSVEDIPDQVDLAVILTPAAAIPGIMEECGRKGVRRVVVETGGFSEFGEEGRRLAERVKEAAARWGIRFIGPNGLGVINRRLGLATSFGILDPSVPAGGISVLSQSGGVMLSILNTLTSEGLGVAKLVSMGNKLDVDENDLLEYLIEDHETHIICMYLEGISDGRRLMELARRTDKPILVHKANIGAAAGRVAASHTAALAVDDRVVDAALRQVGIARFRSTETLVHYLKALALPPLRGNRLAVLSRSGGHAVITADDCDSNGFELATLPADFLEAVQERFRAKVVRLTNPMDLGDLFDLEVYGDLAEATLGMPGVDGMVFLHTYVSGYEGPRSEELFRRLHRISLEADKPIAVYANTAAVEVTRLKRILPGPIFDEPFDAVRALALLRDFGRGMAPSAGRPDGPSDAAAVRTVFERCRREGRDPLLQEAIAVAAAYGIPVVAGRLAVDEAGAVTAAEELGYPVVLKVVSGEIAHKSDFGGVQLNLRSEEGVRAAYFEIMAAASSRAKGAAVSGVLVQPMAPAGRDLIVGAKHDPNFGHVILVGMGGIFVELLGDTSLRVAPFGRRTAEAMLRELRVFPILEGRRGQAPSDLPALIEVIRAVTRLVTDFPEIIELDLNPVRVHAVGEGAAALDARMRLRPAAG